MEVLEKVVASDTIMDTTKHQMIKKLTAVSPCCICDRIPAFEIVFHFMRVVLPALNEFTPGNKSYNQLSFMKYGTMPQSICLCWLAARP